MGKGFVGFGHFVTGKFALNSAALIIGSIHNFGSEFFGIGVIVAIGAFARFDN